MYREAKVAEMSSALYTLDIIQRDILHFVDLISIPKQLMHHF